MNAIEKAIKVIVALQELERQWAATKSHPILPPGFDTIGPNIIVGGPGGGSDGRLNLFSNAGTAPNYCSRRVQPLVLPGRDVRGREGGGRGGRRRRLPRRSVAARASTAPHLEAREQLLPAARRAARPPRGRELSDCLAAVGLDPAPQGFGAATDLAWYGERKLPGIICGPGRLAQCHVADEYLDASQLDLAAKVYAQMLVVTGAPDQTVVCPPSTARSWPVMWRAPSPARKTASAAWSAGSASGRAGSRAATRPRCRE